LALVDFVIISVLFVVFGLGLVFVCQAIIGGEIRSEGGAFGLPLDLEHPGPSHPREKHPWRLAGIGLALIAIAIGLGVILL
jgi:hypothetical protein